MTNLREQIIIDTTQRAIKYWLRAQIVAGKTEQEVKELYDLPETKKEIKASANRLMN